VTTNPLAWLSSVAWPPGDGRPVGRVPGSQTQKAMGHSCAEDAVGGSTHMATRGPKHGMGAFKQQSYGG